MRVQAATRSVVFGMLVVVTIWLSTWERPASAQQPCGTEPVNLVSNGHFASGSQGWVLTEAIQWTSDTGSDGTPGYLVQVDTTIPGVFGQTFDTSAYIGLPFTVTYDMQFPSVGTWFPQVESSGIVTTSSFTVNIFVPQTPLGPPGFAYDNVRFTVTVPPCPGTRTPTATPTETPTNTSTETPTNTPTETPTNTPTEPPTNTPTETPTNTPTETPTSTPTNTSTTTATATPTSTPSETPTNTPTHTATSTPTDVPPTATSTATPTDVPPTGTMAPVDPGAAIVTIVTSDGSPIPDDTIVCLGDACQALDAITAAATPSGTSATFRDLVPGTYPLTVVVGVAQVHASSVEIAAGTTTTVPITLDVAAPTEAPGTPDDGGVGPGGGNDDSSNGDGGDPGTGPDGGGASGGGAAVTSLPSTGAGDTPALGIYLVLLISVGLIATAAALAWKQRRI